MQTKIAAPNVGGIATIADAKAMSSCLAHGQTPKLRSEDVEEKSKGKGWVSQVQCLRTFR